MTTVGETTRTRGTGTATGAHGTNVGGNLGAGNVGSFSPSIGFNIGVPNGTPSPYIEPFKLNTTAFVGQTAYLPCVVKHLGDKVVIT